MARENTQHKLDNDRPSRVHITYDVETGSNIERKELPFVMGVLGDFSGQPKESLAAMRARKFVEITPATFDAVLKGMAPSLAFSVENKLKPGAPDLVVDLTFESMKDFSPENVAENVKPLKALLQLRRKLSALRGSLQGNHKLDDLLVAAMKDAEGIDKLKQELEDKGAGE